MAQPSNKKLVLSFVLLVLLTSWSYEAFIIFGGGVARFGLAGLVILMWIPGLLSILLRLVLGLGFGDVRFIAGRPRYYGYALLIPLALALITGLLSVILDIRDVQCADDNSVIDSLRRQFGNSFDDVQNFANAIGRAIDTKDKAAIESYL